MHKLFYFSIVLIIVLGACASPTPVEPTATTAPPFKVTVNSNRVISLGPIYIADAEGYFAEQNIDAEITVFERSSLALPLLATGELDVYNGGLVSGVFNTIASAENVNVVADKGFIGRGECSYHGILLRQDLYESDAIKRPSDLKGQVVSADTAGISAYMLTTYLKQDGLTLEDIQMMEVPKESVVEAFTNKSIAAAGLQDPFISVVAKTGVASLWLKAEDVIEGYQVAVVIFGPKLIKDNPDVGVRFMIAYLKGVKQYNEGKTDRNVDIISQYTDISREDIQTACWPPIREDGQIDYDSIDAFQQWNVDMGLLEQPVTKDKFWNPYYVEQAYAFLNK